MKPKQLLVLTHWYPSPEAPFEGIFIERHIQIIKLLGFNPCVVHIRILPGKPHLHKEITPFTGGYRINLTSRLWKLFIALPMLQWAFLRNDLLRMGAGKLAIHSNLEHPTAVVGHFLARELELKHIITFHWSRARRKLMWSPLLRRAIQHAHQRIAVSEYLRRQISEVIALNPFAVVPNYIDESHFHYTPFEEPRKISERKATKITIIGLGGYHRNQPKLPDLAITAICQVATEDKKRFEVNLIGNGKKVKDIQQTHCTNVALNFLGYLPPLKIAEILRDSDFLFHASKTETFSVAIGESLMCGTPVLASDVGAIPEQVNSTNGRLVKNTLESWKSGIRDITRAQFNRRLISESQVKLFGKHQVFARMQKAFDDCGLVSRSRHVSHHE